MSSEYNWIYRNKPKPAENRQFLESLSRVIFQAGLNRKVMEKKWPAFGKAFFGFEVGRVADLDDEDIERLMNDASIIRNQKKIQATVHNAQEILQISKEYGSFRKFLDTIIKEEGADGTIRTLAKRFNHVGRSTAAMFLWIIGEEVPHP